MKSKSKILFFTSFPPPNTGQTIATKLIYESIDPYFYLNKINIVDKKRLSRDSGKFSLSVFFFLCKNLAKLVFSLHKKNYDFVYVVYAPSSFALVRDFLITLIVKKFSKAKLIAHIHSGNYGVNFNSPIKNKMFSYIINKVDRLIFLSPMLNNLNNIVSVNKIFYLTNMISKDVICNSIEVFNKINNKKNRVNIKIYYISNMIKEKGYEDVLNAAEIYKNNYSPNFILYLVGGWKSPELLKEIENKLSVTGLSDQVKIVGEVRDRSIIKEFFLDADIFVLPTYYSIEAQPLSIIEALNASTPVVSTFHASIPEMIRNNHDGILVHKQKPEEIARAFSILTDYKIWKRYAENARETYISKFSEKAVKSKLLNVFDFN